MISEEKEDVDSQDVLRRQRIKWARQDFARPRGEKNSFEKSYGLAIALAVAAIFVITGLVIR